MARHPKPTSKKKSDGDSTSQVRIIPNGIGKLRRSTVASTFGPGAIADFRTKSGAPVSVVMAGLDEWVRQSAGKDEMVHDPRLEKLLKVDRFRLPPVSVDEDDPNEQRLPAVRFPKWLQCPECRSIAPVNLWANEIGDAGRWCAHCTGPKAAKDRVFVTPVRFIIACDHGHIEDFPWKWWARHKPECEVRSKLRLVSVRAGLAGLMLECINCREQHAMEGAFDKKVISSALKCKGERPWLAAKPEICESDELRVVQRGASNLYFQVGQSSLLIPPWDSEIESRLGDYWADVMERDPQDRLQFILKRIEQNKIDIPPDWNEKRFAELVVERAAHYENIDIGNLRREEWQQLLYSGVGGAPASRDFEVHSEDVPTHIVPKISHVARVVRLRELRALRGFTRINPPSSPDEITDVRVAALSEKSYGWLPAVEVRGEGIFIALNQDCVDGWEQLASVQHRAAVINAARVAEFLDRHGKEAIAPSPLAPHYLLAHAFAHAVMRQLSLECGYSTASLRERIYADTGTCGILVYTATTDADGTLGGLQRQGEPERLGPTLLDAIASQRWCSSDPLCIRDVMTLSNATNLAACHACLLAPETSCEHFNQYLDRALLVGTPEDPETGFFRDWLA
ncbi:DUF1998 domain-containing protein [soil metagenome]